MGDKKIEELETVKLEHCEDCMAYYSVGYNHTCPPWLKALVQFNKDIKNSQKNIMKEEKLINNLKEKIFDILEDEFNPLDGSAKAELIAEDNKELSEKMINEVRSTITDIQREMVEKIENKRILHSSGQCLSCNNKNILGHHSIDTDEHMVFYNQAVNDIVDSLQSPVKEQGEVTNSKS